MFWTEGAICLVNARSGDLLNWRGAAMRLSLWGGVALTAPTILGLVARTTFAGSASRRCATPPVDRMVDRVCMVPVRCAISSPVVSHAMRLIGDRG